MTGRDDVNMVGMLRDDVRRRAEAEGMVIVNWPI